MSENRMSRWLLAILYVLSIILLREWLIPVMALTNTGGLSFFLIFIVIAFMLSLFEVKWWLAVPVKIIYIISVVHVIYLKRVIPSIESLSVLMQDFLSNFSIFMQGEWSNITYPLRTTLFFVLIWMTTYLISYWINKKRSMLLFYVMTVIFIATIDTFSAYSADDSIFKIMAVGLLLVGLLFISKFADTYQLKIPFSKYVAAAVPLFFIIILSGFFALLLPKQAPIWPDPVPFLQAVVDGSEERNADQSVAKSGYSPDDSALGGPFLEDDTLVFEAAVERQQYWKIETKNTYTSKGWAQPVEDSPVIYKQGMPIGQFEENENIEVTASKQAQLHVFETFPFLVYPYGMTKADASVEVDFHYVSDNDKYWTKLEEEIIPLDAYDITYVAHDFSLKALRATEMDALVELQDDFYPYLQLPETLPERVVELAKSITESSTSVYEKTKAIERYYGRSGFTYDREEVAIPSEEDDYVDQFLFDTKKGYCDNFSTSMVVMLRTIGIPARWVKGFAPGEVAKNASGESVYQVTNNEAHSWVEAYMPSVGWMPFEPTIGFNAPARIQYDMELDASDPEMKEKLEKEQPVPEKPQQSKPSTSTFNIGKWTKSWMGGNAKWILATGIAIVIVSVIFYALRQKWMPTLRVKRYRAEGQSWEDFSKSYTDLLKQLERIGLNREEGETLSNYARRVDMRFTSENMSELTKAYEIGIYGEDTKSHDWQRLQLLWEDLIKKTTH